MMRRRFDRRGQRGAVLLEVLAAVTILTIAGLSAVMLVAQTSHTVGQARRTERDLRDASRFLEVVALWTRDDYDRRLGERAQGPWLLHVAREGDDVYVLTLTDSTAARRPLLRTATYRPRLGGPSAPRGGADAGGL